MMEGRAWCNCHKQSQIEIGNMWSMSWRAQKLFTPLKVFPEGSPTDFKLTDFVSLLFWIDVTASFWALTTMEVLQKQLALQGNLHRCYTDRISKLTRWRVQVRSTLYWLYVWPNASQTLFNCICPTKNWKAFFPHQVSKSAQRQTVKQRV